MARVLVVDNEPAMQLLRAATLRAFGHECAVVPDGESALRRLDHEPFDALVVDLGMDGLGGVTLLQEMRRRDRQIPTVVVTAHAGDLDPEQQAALRAFPDVPILPKPFTARQLAIFVSSVLGTPAAE